MSNFFDVSNDLIDELLELDLSKRPHKKIKDDPVVLCGCIWILNKIYNHPYHKFTTTVNNACEGSGLNPKFYDKAKKVLKNHDYINYTTAKTKPVKIYGKTQFRNYEGSHYSYGRSIDIKKHFTTRSKHYSTTIPTIDPVALGYITEPKPKQSNPTTTQQNQPQDKKSEYAKLYANYGSYPYELTHDIHLPHDDMFKEIEDTYLLVNNKQKIIKNDKGYDGVFLIIDEIRRMTRDPFAELFDEISLEIDLEFFVNLNDSNTYIPLSQENIQTLIGDGLTLVSQRAVTNAKKTLLDHVHSQQSRTSNHKGLGWLERKNYMTGLRSDAFKLSKKFYEKGNGDPYASRKYHTITRTRHAPFEVLANCTLSPEVFNVFDQITEQKQEEGKWQDDTEVQLEKRKLIEFEVRKTFFKKGTHTERVFTHIASLSKEFRKYILIDGESTVEIDIKTAHALFLAHTKEFKQYTDQRAEWLELVQNKDLYEHLIHLIEPKSKDDVEWNKLSSDKQRKVIKRIFNAYLNGGGKDSFDEYYSFNFNFRNIMKSHFDIVDKVVEQLGKPVAKGGYSVPRSDGSKPKNGIALELQRIESDIMGTHFMCKSKYKCVSIHDGLLVKKADADKIKKAVKRRAKKILGFDITVEKK